MHNLKPTNAFDIMSCAPTFSSCFSQWFIAVGMLSQSSVQFPKLYIYLRLQINLRIVDSSTTREHPSRFFPKPLSTPTLSSSSTSVISSAAVDTTVPLPSPSLTSGLPSQQRPVTQGFASIPFSIHRFSHRQMAVQQQLCNQRMDTGHYKPRRTL